MTFSGGGGPPPPAGKGKAIEKGAFYNLVTRQPQLTPQELRDRRVALIRAIQNIRGRPLVIYATNVNVAERRIPAYMHREDIIPLSEVLDSVAGRAVDILVETPGGLAEVADEDVTMTEVRLTKIVLDGIEIPIAEGEQLVSPNDEVVAEILESMAAIEEAERPNFILTTSTSHG